jgi:polysaccharide deacetylase family protein (PEP-CTERM system associated)
VATVLNAMTVDVEDYFQVSAFAGLVVPSEWPSFESRVCRNTDRLLKIFDDADVRATFFVLGWVAERFPALVKRIHQAGHELASHSYDHGLVYEKTPDAFLLDLDRAKVAIEQAAGVAIQGYRAPSFSITTRSLWALDLLAAEGYTYDASIYPIRHDRYGISSWSRQISQITRAGRSLWEVPGSTVRRLGNNVPVGGGGYFRLLPYSWTRYGIQTLNEVEGEPMIFYVHPWEIDPDQPRLSCGALTRVRHYSNLAGTEDKLKRLLQDGVFGTVTEVLAARQQRAVRVPASISSPPHAEMATLLPQVRSY